MIHITRPSSAAVVDFPGIRQMLDRLIDDRERSSAYAQVQLVDVVFAATAHGNTVIRHALRAPTPHSIVYQPVGLQFSAAPAAAPVIYEDVSLSAAPWGDTYIVLRSSIPALRARLLLGVPRHV